MALMVINNLQYRTMQDIYADLDILIFAVRDLYQLRLLLA